MKKYFSDVPAAKIVRRSNSEGGFSLLEMLIAMTIFLIITGSIYGLLQVGRVDRNRSSRRTDIMKNARAAVHLMGRDILNAGLSYHKKGGLVPNNFLSTTLNLPTDVIPARDTLTSVVPGNNIFANNLQEDPTIKTDVISFVYRDMDFNGGNAIQLSSVSKGSANNIAKIKAKVSGTMAPVSNYDLFLVESNTSQFVVMATNKLNNTALEIAPTDPLGINQAYNGSGLDRSLLVACTATVTDNCTTYSTTDPDATISIATLKRIRWVSYKVKSDGTLVRMIYGDNADKLADEQIQERPLAYNVKDLQIKYLLDDGTATDDPTVGPDGVAGTNDDTPERANQITQVTISLTVASTEADEASKKPEVITLNATFSTRNIQYDAG